MGLVKQEEHSEPSRPPWVLIENTYTEPKVMSQIYLFIPKFGLLME